MPKSTRGVLAERANASAVSRELWKGLIRLPFANLPRLFLALTAAYFFASLGHFSHNAQFICEYPNLPAWLTSAKVYAAWAAITAVGVAGFLCDRVIVSLNNTVLRWSPQHRG